MATATDDTEHHRIGQMIALVSSKHRDDVALVAIADAVMLKLRQVGTMRDRASVPFSDRITLPAISGQDLAATLALGSAMVELHTARDILRVALERLGEKV